MANWCDTVYKLTGEYDELAVIYEILRSLSALKRPSVPNGFGSNWLGCVVTALGGDPNKVSCRGTVERVEFDGCEFTCCTFTAWGPCNEVFELIRKKYPSVKYYYYAEDAEGGLYQTNDALGKYFSNRVVVDLDTDKTGWHTEYFKSLSDACSWLGHTFGRTICSEADIEKLDEELQEQNPDHYVELSKIRVVSA